MGQQSSWLPIPFWLAVVMFVVGIAVGVGLGYAFSVGYQTTTVAKPWEDDRARVMVPQQDENAKTVQAKAQTPKTSPSTTRVRLDPDDKRLLSGMINGPVKRALLGTVKHLDPFVTTCRTEAEKTFKVRLDPLAVHVELEAIGGLATVTLVETINRSEADLAFQQCLFSAVSKVLINFPVENGNYALLHVFSQTPSNSKPPAEKKGSAPAHPAQP